MVEHTKQFTVFAVGEEWYGIDILHLSAIELLDGIRIVPNADPAIMGVVNIRGSLLPVVDLCYLLYQKKIEATETCRLLVCAETLGSFVLAVSEASDICEIDLASIEELSDAPYKKGISHVEGKLVTILDGTQLAKEIEHQVQKQ
ncbi:hypothetical protein BC8716_14780 [Shouchella clausii]|nr:hypothetical protein BC8716_14780 [Shouchella clausii]PAD15697.1 hypothetical protein CHH74_05395 [Shouchella clausii]QNM43508.1 chemotaxis protein CheW [Shouchella clausii]